MNPRLWQPYLNSNLSYLSWFQTLQNCTTSYLNEFKFDVLMFSPSTLYWYSSSYSLAIDLDCASCLVTFMLNSLSILVIKV